MSPLIGASTYYLSLPVRFVWRVFLGAVWRGKEMEMEKMDVEKKAIPDDDDKGILRVSYL